MALGAARWPGPCISQIHQPMRKLTQLQQPMRKHPASAAYIWPAMARDGTPLPLAASHFANRSSPSTGVSRID